MRLVLHYICSHICSHTQVFMLYLFSEQEAVKALRILQNEKAPLVRKRQVMRNTFGDYRKKMEEEERKFATST